MADTYLFKNCDGGEACIPFWTYLYAKIVVYGIMKMERSKYNQEAASYIKSNVYSII